MCVRVCVCAAEVVANKLNGTRTEGETITIWLLQYKFNFVANSHNCHDIFIYRYRPSALLSASFNVIIFINNRCLCKIKQNMSCIPHLNTQTYTHAHIHSYATHVCETDLAMCEKKNRQVSRASACASASATLTKPIKNNNNRQLKENKPRRPLWP